MLQPLKEKGTPIDRQQFDWMDLVRIPTSKLDTDAFTRVRIILMNGIETEALRFQHSFARADDKFRLPLAQIRRIEQHQQTLINWLLPPDLTPLDTTIGYEQVAIEVTASVAQHEPDAYLAQVYRFGLLEDFDHLYRFSALMDRIYGCDPNAILQTYTDIMPGRPTQFEHRAPEDDLRTPYDRSRAHPLTKFHAATITAVENQTHDYYMNIGPMFADPVARQLYAEIASIEEQHTTQYESLLDPRETWLEKWLVHEATELYNYVSCAHYESDPGVKAIWERFIDYELGHLHFVADLFKEHERRDPAEVIPEHLPELIDYKTHREFVRTVLANEVDLRASGTRFIHKEEERDDSPSVLYRRQVNSKGSPSEIVARGYCWKPGTEIARDIPVVRARLNEAA